MKVKSVLKLIDKDSVITLSSTSEIVEFTFNKDLTQTFMNRNVKEIIRGELNDIIIVFE